MTDAREASLVLHLELVGQPVVQAGEDPPELLGERHERTDRLRHLSGGHVHCERDEVAREREHDHLADRHTGLVLRFRQWTPRGAA